MVKLNDIVIMKKSHPCGNDKFIVTRQGADYKLLCIKCKHTVMLDAVSFNKKLKRVETSSEDNIT